MLIELLYRERFGLSDRQMQREPAANVRYWLEVEHRRQAQQQQS